jgi:hypothetical protein
VGLATALEQLGYFYEGSEGLWSHAGFDASILQTAYRALGLGTPWHYRRVYDLRTLRMLWEASTDDGPARYKEQWPELDGTAAHHALEDARWQAGVAQGMLQKFCT